MSGSMKCYGTIQYIANRATQEKQISLDVCHKKFQFNRPSSTPSGDHVPLVAHYRENFIPQSRPATVISSGSQYQQPRPATVISSGSQYRQSRPATVISSGSQYRQSRPATVISSGSQYRQSRPATVISSGSQYRQSRQATVTSSMSQYRQSRPATVISSGSQYRQSRPATVISSGSQYRQSRQATVISSMSQYRQLRPATVISSMSQYRQSRQATVISSGSQYRQLRPATVISSGSQYRQSRPATVISSGSHQQSRPTTDLRDPKTRSLADYRLLKLRSKNVTCDLKSPETMAALLHKYLQEDHYMTFVSTLAILDSDTRQQVVNIKYRNNNNLVFAACQMNRLNYLYYMLSECNPDLEISGICYEDEKNIVKGTPLWMAVFSGCLSMTKLLISHQAEVNTLSSSGSTALMAACSSGQQDIVFLLVANGADIYFKNDKGLTCLMMATQHPEILHFLLKSGSRVNETDRLGNTALHYAANDGCLQTVHILIKMGANPFITNLDKCNAILAAAKVKEEHIVEYLMTVRAPKTSDIIKTYIVLGAVTILLDDNYTVGKYHWQKAITLCQLSPGSHYPFKLKKSVLSEYFSVNDLVPPWEQTTDHHNVLILQALVICESLYGSREQSFINLLVYQGAVCADNDNLLMALRLWTLAYKLNLDNTAGHTVKHDLNLDNLIRHTVKHDLNSQTSLVKNVEYIVQILFQVQKLIVHDSLESEVSVPEYLTRNVLCLITHHIEQLVDRTVQHNTKYVTYLLQCFLGVINLYLHMYSAAFRHLHIGMYLQRIIQLDPRGDRNETILHMCLDMRLLETLDISQHMTLYWPSVELIDILLIVGADPLAKDVQGNTVLHTAILLNSAGYTITSELINTLLKRGVHYDQVNHRGQAAFDLLPSDDGFKQIAHFLSLKCLAARAVATYKLTYTGEIPRDLYSFVELHTF